MHTLIETISVCKLFMYQQEQQQQIHNKAQ